MPKETYYDILGISKDANDNDIKKAFRALSLKYHPDRNPNEDTTEQFQKIGEAYETLSDPEKRRQYENELNGIPFGMPFSHMDSMNEFQDMNNILNMMFGGGMPGMPGMHGMGGPGPGIRIFHNGGMGGPQFFQQFQKPASISKVVTISLNHCYDGGSIPCEIDRFVINNGIKYTEKITLNVPIHKGIHENETIVIEGEGNIVNDMKGDVKLNFKIEEHPVFKRRESDLVYKKKISLKEALCGFSFELKHLNGKMLFLNNKSNRTIITPETKKTIPNLGIEYEGKTGNLIIEFIIDFPMNLSEEQMNTISSVL
uniref:J domain-containing protein n=1 Tax=viral metagenome TaxID=1070528 RepID=A0A6C0ERJ1_9ZZZZ